MTLYTYEQFDKDIEYLVRFIKQHNIDNITALYRGGLPLGVRLSNECNLPLSIIDFQRYDGNSVIPNLIKYANIYEANNILIVDDIADKGISLNMTIKYLSNINEKFNVMTLYGSNKHSDKWKYIHEHDGEWVKFIPWEGK